MASTIQQIDKLHNTKNGRISFGAAELIIAFIISAVAVDSGEIWQYLLASVLAIGGIHNLFSAYNLSKIHAKKAKS